MNEYYPFTNKPLPYEYDALEPYIDTKTMHLHHDKHLQTYINNLNDILKSYPSLQPFSLTQLIYNIERLPQEVQTPIRNQAGGVYNHQFYFEGMKNTSEKAPFGRLAKEIDKQFGGFDKFKSEFKKASLSVFGSGYSWLVVSNKGKIKIATTPNQNNPIEQNLCPLLCIDVWEHVYYLKHYNVRSDYIDNWFEIVNWAKAESCYPDFNKHFN
ncbi:MAG: superoxide dismutase [Oscillospiraceae bacterium]